MSGKAEGGKICADPNRIHPTPASSSISMSFSLKKPNSDTTLLRWQEALKRKKCTQLEEDDSKDLETAQENSSMEGQATINLATSEEIGRNKTDEEKLECPRHEATSMEGDTHMVHFQALG